MHTSLDCIPCLLRQALDAARLITPDPMVHEQIMRDVLECAYQMDLNQSPPFMAQHFHRRLRELTRISDPYRAAKRQANELCNALAPKLRPEILASQNPLMTAARIAIAGNMIDMGANGHLSNAEIENSMHNALDGSFWGDEERFIHEVAQAKQILYLADNAGEIAFDRLLIEQISPERVTVAVRGFPTINDATMIEAEEIGLNQMVKVISNGSDAPGTILNDCSPKFKRIFHRADLIIAKGQGNFESLSHYSRNIFFLFKIKCPVIADQIKKPLGTQVLIHHETCLWTSPF
jgi:uncharacterized protein with ATP-grasp and redox domains